MALSDLTDLISYWRLNEHSGTITDYHGSNDLSFSVGLKGDGSVHFDEDEEDYLFILDNSDLSTGDVDFAWAGWIYLTTQVSGGKPILLKGTAAAATASEQEYSLAYNFGADTLRFEVSNGSTLTAINWGSTLAVETWYFVYAYHDSTANQIGINVNDGTVATAAHSVGSQDSAFDVTFGKATISTTTRYLDGFLGPFGFWKGGLPSGATITSIYNSGNGKQFSDLTSGEKTNLVAWWNLSEYQGSRADSVGSNNLTDYTSQIGYFGNTTKSRLHPTFFNGNFLADIADNTDLSTGDVDFCIAAWVFSDGYEGGSQVILSKDDISTEREYNLILDSAVDRFRFSVSSNGTSLVSVYANNLGAPVNKYSYFVVAWHDSSENTINIQVNNGSVDSQAHSDGVRDGVAKFTIGDFEDGGIGVTWKRVIGPVLFWKGSIPSSSTLTELYNSGLGIDYPFTGIQIADVGTQVASNGLGQFGQNAQAPKSQTLSQVTLAATTYEAITYWDSSLNLVIGKRIAGGSWTLYAMDGAGGRPTITLGGTDNHDVATLGIDPDGYIHVCYDMHNEALNYRVSDAAIDSWTGGMSAESDMLGTAESSVSYPTFFNDPSNSLYFMYREGSANDGDLYFYKYNESTTTWAAATGTGTNGILSDGQGTRGIYWSLAPVFDSDFGSGGEMHLSWTWSESSTANDLKNICYVKWDGTNFTKADDTSQTVPITDSNAEVVVSIAIGNNLRAWTSIDSDSNRYPHIVYIKADIGGSDTIYHIYYNGSSWQSATEILSSGYGFQYPADPPWTMLAQPKLAIDRSTDTAYILVNGHGLGTGLYRYDATSPFSSWSQSTITTTQLGTWNTQYNRVRWESSTTFQFPLMPFSARGHTFPIRILEIGDGAIIPRPGVAFSNGVMII